MAKMSIYLVKICAIYKKYVDIVHCHRRYCLDKKMGAVTRPDALNRSFTVLFISNDGMDEI